MAMRDYLSTTRKLAASDERIIALLDELNEVRRQARSCGYTNSEHAIRCEKLFDVANKEQEAAQKTLDQLTAMHRAHWQHELQFQLDATRDALAPLVRAWRIAHRAFGATGHCPAWVQDNVFGALLSEIQEQVSQETHEMPLDPPKSFAIDRADEELRR